jgi:CheY-like chemotaxis protein
MGSRSYRILVVDDLADNLFLLQTILETSGYEVELASCGSSALAKIFASPPDLVLLDMMMPGMNGFEVIQKLRQYPHLKELPIVLLTAYGESLAQECLLVGANDWMGKPLDFEELLQKVRAFIPSN